MSDNEENNVLLSKWLNGELSQQEINAIDPETKNRLEKAMQEIDTWTLPDVKAYQEVKTTITKQAKVVKLASTRWVLGIAASVAILAGLFFFMPTDSKHTIATQDITQEIILPDGSFVALNKNSSITYSTKAWEKGKRELELSGEAYFRVKKGAIFSVSTEHSTTEVLGTEFNVLARKGFESVTCYEGKVAVNTGSDKEILTEGKGVTVDVQGNLSPFDAPILNQPRWSEEYLQFSNSQLKEIIAVLEANYNITITSGKIDLKRRYTGRVSQTDVKLALETIFLPMGISYTMNENEVILK